LVPSAGTHSKDRHHFWSLFASIRMNLTNREESVMDANFKIALAVVAGAALGATAMQGLHAQAKPKAYTVAEFEVLDDAAFAAYLPVVAPVIKAAGGHTFNTSTSGRIIGITGAPPKHVSLIEWDSTERAQAFLNSEAYKNTWPQRDKAEKFTRTYLVEATAN
jgi:uncharacterized protein (DUF1330 family)